MEGDMPTESDLLHRIDKSELSLELATTAQDRDAIRAIRIERRALMMELHSLRADTFKDNWFRTHI